MRFFFLLTITAFAVSTFAQADSIFSKKTVINTGITFSPQILFVGGLDAGCYANVESNPFNNKLAVAGGIDLRNKWFHLPVGNVGLDTRSLKTGYSFTGLGYVGAGRSFFSKKGEKNNLYITVTPYVFSFRETVEAGFISNSVQSTSFGMNAGITWSNTKVTRKGRKINTQLYVPLFSRYILDQLRFMNLKFGIQLK